MGEPPKLNILLESFVTPAPVFPNVVTVRVIPPGSRPLAVMLRFEMSRKNPFDFVAFIGGDGTATIRSDELLRAFDQEREFFLMDYVDPRVGFTGKVTGKVLSDDELRAAIKAAGEYGKYYSYPVGYEEGLRQSLKHGQHPTAHRIEIAQSKF